MKFVTVEVTGVCDVWVCTVEVKVECVTWEQVCVGADWAYKGFSSVVICYGSGECGVEEAVVPGGCVIGFVNV